MSQKINTDNLKDMANAIKSIFPEKTSVKNFIPKDATSEDVDQIMTLNSSGSSSLSKITSSDHNNIGESVNLSMVGGSIPESMSGSNLVFKPDVYTFYDYNIPKNTLYLIIVLIIVGIIIWYMTSNTNKKKEKKIIEEDDKKE